MRYKTSKSVDVDYQLLKFISKLEKFALLDCGAETGQNYQDWVIFLIKNRTGSGRDRIRTCFVFVDLQNYSSQRIHISLNG